MLQYIICVVVTYWIGLRLHVPVSNMSNITCRKSAIKAVFFDLDDTLVSTSECDARAYLQVTALANKRLKSKVNVTKLVEDFQARFKRSPWCPDLSVDVDAWRGDLWAIALHAQGVQNPAALGRELHETFRRVRLANFSFLPEVPALMKYLDAKGIRVAIITNGHHQVQREKLLACRADRLFPDSEQIIVGGEEEREGREQKPAAEIFHKACRAVRCEPNEAIHVGDDLSTDVQVRSSSAPVTELQSHYFKDPGAAFDRIIIAGRHKCRTPCDSLDK